MKTLSLGILIAAAVVLQPQCRKAGSPTPPPSGGDTTTNTASDITEWLTTPDQSFLLSKLSTVLNFTTGAGSGQTTIAVDSTQTFQTVDGFGFCLTGGSAYVLYNMPPAVRTPLLQELFGSDSTSIGISYLRLSMGSSDMDAAVYSYDDALSPDTLLSGFSLSVDTLYKIPLLKLILAINPNIKIIATPWSAPPWMKTNASSEGGSLITSYYGVYAQYFVKYIQAMQAQGITINAITPQNEPLNPDNNPSLYMTAGEEDTLIREDLGPAFAGAGLSTKIVVYDHNCDDPGYATTILSDPAAYNYVDGSAFHLYAGSITALGTVHSAYPNKNVYFTEQYTASTGSFSGDLQWHMQNVVLGSMNNWSKVALEWNLATDGNYGPHTPGGCTTCQGAVTIVGSSVSRNVSYYIVAQVSKFVPSGSVRIASTSPGSLVSTAFLTPVGKKVLVVVNTGSAVSPFVITYQGKGVSVSLNPGSVGTFIW
jgi:glucosylceramidase